MLQYLEKFRHFGKIVFGNFFDGWFNIYHKFETTLTNHASKSSRNFTAIVLRQNHFYSIGPWSHWKDGIIVVVDVDVDFVCKKVNKNNNLGRI